MEAVFWFLVVVVVCIGGLVFAVNMFPKNIDASSRDDKFPGGMA